MAARQKESGAERRPAGEEGGGLLDESLEEIFAAELAEHLQSVPPQVELLASAATRAVAREQLQRLFHTIKGSAALVGRGEVAAAALSLERFFRSPGESRDDWQRAQSTLEQLFAAADADAPVLLATFDAPADRAPGAIDAELRQAFAADAAEVLDYLDDVLPALARAPGDRATIDDLLGRLHGLKGATAAVGLDAVGERLHAAESLLESVRDAAGPADPAWLDGLDALGGEIRRRIDDAIGTHFSAAAPAERDGTVRIPVRELDALVDLVAQLVVNRVQIEQRIRSFADLREKLDGCRRRLAETAEGFDRRLDDRLWQTPAARADGNGNGAADANGAGSDADGAGAEERFFNELEFDKYDDVTVFARSLIETASDAGEIAGDVARLVDRLGDQARHFSRVTSGLQRRITGLRRVPIESALRRLERPVREAARGAGKSVELRVEGGEVALDRGLVDALHAPLLHLVRNAVAHGIERPETRRARGKCETGTVRVRAALRSEDLLVEVSDDGGGLDLDAAATLARQKHLIGDQAGRDEILAALFRPGFSTGSAVSELAGRGIGLDVVAREVARLGGSIDVDTRAGAGTIVRLSLPVQSAIDEALLVEVGAQVLAVPVRWVEHAMPVEMSAVRGWGESAGPLRVATGGTEVPLLALGPLIGEPMPADACVAVVLRSAPARFALLVDRVSGQQEVAVRPLGRLLADHPFLSGSAISGSGAVVFVVHPRRLAEWTNTGAAPRPAAPAEAVAAQTERAGAVLVVDDSISVRKLAARFLQAAGLEVVTAVDGMDAIEKLTHESFRAVVTDLEMPRMHGYELIAEMRRHPRWRAVPIVVCTSRAGEKHRRRARELGAEGYVTKPFTQEDLVDEIGRVCGKSEAAAIRPADRQDREDREELARGR